MRLFDRLVEGRRNWLGLPERRPGLGDVVDYLDDQVSSGEVLLHGSSSRTIELFEPRQQSRYQGAPVLAVFASTDPVWSMFFALTDAERAGARWNMCLLPERSGALRTRYFFSVGAAPAQVWCDGAVYLLPRASFAPSDEPSEWVATRPVQPMAVVPVVPADFPFGDRVFRHEEHDPEWRKDLRLLAECLSSRRKPERPA